MINRFFYENIEDNLGDVSDFPKPTYWTTKIIELLKERGINYIINSEGLYDVWDDKGVNLSACGLESFGEVQFGTVSGPFNCRNNKLQSLEGSPRNVKAFDCDYN